MQRKHRRKSKRPECENMEIIIKDEYKRIAQPCRDKIERLRHKRVVPNKGHKRQSEEVPQIHLEQEKNERKYRSTT